MPKHRPTVRQAAAILIALSDEPFGGKHAGRYRLSRKAMREVLGRRHIPARVLEELIDEVFEAGYLLLDLDTHFAVLEQRIVHNYRNVTQAALAKVAGFEATAAGES